MTNLKVGDYIIWINHSIDKELDSYPPLVDHFYKILEITNNEVALFRIDFEKHPKSSWSRNNWWGLVNFRIPTSIEVKRYVRKEKEFNKELENIINE